MPYTIRFLSVCGMLGYGYPEESLRTGLAWQPAFIGVDSGSTDPGPYYLGNGTSFLRPLQVKRDLELAYRLLSLAPKTLVSGDANRDGAVNLRDPIAVLRWQLGGPAISRDAADLNDDGRVSLTDAISLLWIVAGLR